MSRRRSPGDVVQRAPGSGFVGSPEPSKVRICDDPPDPCLLGCGDPACREWPNLEVVEGPFKGNYLYHVSECQMSDFQEGT